MARPRTPTNVLDARGAFRKNPQRERVDPPTAGKLRPPPKGSHFNDDRRQVWKELVKAAPKDVLTESDRFALEIACLLMVEFRENPLDFPAAKLVRLETLLGKFGMTPADRAKVAGAKDKKKNTNPFADLL